MKKLSRPWYRRCGADFIQGTMGLSLEEKGAYSLCLDLIYDHQGPIPDDARWLAGICGVSVRKWSAIRETLIQHNKISCFDGKLFNFRAGKELEILLETHRNLAENGAKGGNKTAENNTTLKENNDLAEAGLEPRTGGEKRREEKRREEVTHSNECVVSVSAKAPNLTAVFEETFWPKYPNKVGKPVALKAFLLAAKRADLETIFAGLDRYVSKTDDRQWCNPATWLNQDRWGDAPQPVSRGSPQKPPQTAGAQRRENHMNKLKEMLGAEPDDEFNGCTIDIEANDGNWPADL